MQVIYMPASITKRSDTMFYNDHDLAQSENVIPFAKREEMHDEPMVSTIMTVVAVNILHDADESPEAKLVEMIEGSGEAEIVEAMDAFDELFQPAQAPELMLKAYNDNE